MRFWLLLEPMTWKPAMSKERAAVLLYRFATLSISVQLLASHVVVHKDTQVD